MFEAKTDGKPVSTPNTLIYRCAIALCLVVSTLPLSGCGRDSRDEQVVQALVEIREELKGLRADLAKAKPSQPAGARQPQNERVDSIEIGASPTLGSRKASVALVEFSDYQCPFCARHHKTTFDELKRKYVDSGRVLLVFKDFPLQSHKEARPASIAARCAGRYGAYWAMQRAIFDNPTQLNEAFYMSAATRLGLDPKQFAACRRDESIAKAVDADAAHGSLLGVSGTPSFFVGRLKGDALVDAVKLSGAQPLSAFEARLDEMLRSPN